jgi:hypothetical protein
MILSQIPTTLSPLSAHAEREVTGKKWESIKDIPISPTVIWDGG